MIQWYNQWPLTGWSIVTNCWWSLSLCCQNVLVSEEETNLLVEGRPISALSAQHRVDWLHHTSHLLFVDRTTLVRIVTRNFKNYGVWLIFVIKFIFLVYQIIFWQENNVGTVDSTRPFGGHQGNPNHFGISVCTIDGQRFSIGDTNVPFCLQSIRQVLSSTLCQLLLSLMINCPNSSSGLF